ncbi:MAG TPA: response regulator transcription factor [Flavobacteriales bacterium]|nr:response regulator transcription factor [Flavobacteriales bacterium]HRE95422.1 response regulator transcription factor [Flavobacteriales bacterium]HRJ36582.1 response regulator transcription factor [Flavobacteriales bacterium]HRJ38069.1 response regulator transcription factor [Flavobacteriales bacterium]
MSKEKTQRILLVDDEADIIELLKYNLEKEGYDVSTASNGREAIEVAKKTKPHLILMDVMMPGMDGVEACMSLRDMDEFKTTIIAFLTARGEDYSQIAGFDSGADDYITKPIKPRVLISRIKALLRRGSTLNVASPESLSGISVDRERYLVFKDGEEMSLPKKEFELLALLLSKPGKVFTREAILNEVWGNDIVVGDRTIDVHIRKLREKLGEDLIRTVKGVGYKLEN